MYDYAHGGNIRYARPEVVDFSANISPLGLPPGVKDAVSLAADDAVRYPDSFSGKLREALADYEGVSPTQIFCGNGASDIIFRLALALRPQKALILAPTFSDYERALSVCGCRSIHRHLLQEQDGFNLSGDILRTVRRERFDLIWLCNPNNPTGCLIPHELVLELVTAAAQYGGRVVVDECFMDFVEDKQLYSVTGQLSAHPNLIILKAFTKIFALAGIRLGYALCADSALMEQLYRHGPDWSVSNLAQAAGVAALAVANSYIPQTVRLVAEEKRRLSACFTQAGLHIFGSNANYLFFRCDQSFDLPERLLREHSIAIRSCANYLGLDSRYCRAGVMGHLENTLLMTAIDAIFKL